MVPLSTDDRDRLDAEKGPVSLLEPEPAVAARVAGIGLSLSGGGYRAMVFHLGSLWRLNDAGLLGRLERISSVSGGSITAARLAVSWPQLGLARGAGTPSPHFRDQVVEPVRALAGTTIDVSAILGGLFLPWVSVGDRVAASYRKRLLGDATLQDLPDHPFFVFNATNMQSGVLWRFLKSYMWDYRVGEVRSPTIPLARAVAASSAFPPFLSPVRLTLDPRSFTPGTGDDLQREPFTSRVVLCDGGVYDNLGLEAVWKSCRSILVSDAGAKMAAEPKPWALWFPQVLRVLDIEDNQVRSLRKRTLIAAYKMKMRDGAYWGIRSDIADYKLPDPLPCPRDRTLELAAVPTRLKRLAPKLQDRLINWGFAVCDAALRAHVDPNLPRPADFPYPESGV
ncbi:MAG: patatin-like phospholipase family protein [Isosphaeraceae bacterium]